MSKILTTDNLAVAFSAIKAELIEKGIEYIVGTQSASTAGWTGVTKSPSLTAGKTIAYKLPFASKASTNVTLNLTLPDGTTTGGKPVYLTGDTRMTTQYGVNSVIVLTYDGAGWRHCEYNTNTTYTNWSLGQGRVRSSNDASVVARTATASSYGLTTGGIVHVIFNTDVAANATISINSKGSKPIMYMEDPIGTLKPIEAGFIKAGDGVTMMYNGAQYVVLTIDRWGKELKELQTYVTTLENNIQQYVDNIADLIVNGCTLSFTGSHVSLDVGSSLPYGKPATLLPEVEKYYVVSEAEVTMDETDITQTAWDDDDYSIQISKVTGNVGINLTAVIPEVYFTNIRSKAGRTATSEIWTNFSNLNFDVRAIVFHFQFTNDIQYNDVSNYLYTTGNNMSVIHYTNSSGVLIGCLMNNDDYIPSAHTKLGNIKLTFGNNILPGKYRFTLIQGATGEGSSSEGKVYLHSRSVGSDIEVDCRGITIEIVGPNEPTRILSETDTDVPTASNDDVLLRKSIKANTWTPIILPFELTGAQLKAIFGNDVEVIEFGKYTTLTTDENDKVATASIDCYRNTFGDSDEFFANYPYIIKTSSDIEELYFENVDVSPAEDEEDMILSYDNGRPWNHSKYKRYMMMAGHYHQSVPDSTNGQIFYFDDNGNIQASDGTVSIPAYSCWLQDTNNEFTANTVCNVVVS